jgi:hypothetical protein
VVKAGGWVGKVSELGSKGQCILISTFGCSSGDVLAWSRCVTFLQENENEAVLGGKYRW